MFKPIQTFPNLLKLFKFVQGKKDYFIWKLQILIFLSLEIIGFLILFDDLQKKMRFGSFKKCLENELKSNQQKKTADLSDKCNKRAESTIYFSYPQPQQNIVI